MQILNHASEAQFSYWINHGNKNQESLNVLTFSSNSAIEVESQISVTRDSTCNDI